MLSCYVNLRSQGRTILLSSTLPIRTCTCRQLPSHEIPGIICIRKKNELLSCQSMCSDQNVVITACDSNSCFYGHGKLSLFERMAKSAEARSLMLKYKESSVPLISQLTLVIFDGLRLSIGVIHADNTICILMTRQDHRCDLVHVVTPCVWRSVTLIPFVNCSSSRSQGIVSC